MRYSPGDRINILVYGSAEFSGDYAINADGTIILPFAGQVPAVGLTNAELISAIERQYLRAGIFTREGLRLVNAGVIFHRRAGAIVHHC
jgi:protein involved in polysaccharide export with SLBB domain